MTRFRGPWLACIACIGLFCLIVCATSVQAQAGRLANSPRPVLWDTLEPIGDSVRGPNSDWQVVPDDLLLLEKDPPKASSDPGYYGREYVFKGDAVVETPTVVAAFLSTKGCLAIYLKQNLPTPAENSKTTVWSRIVEVTPIAQPAGAATITNLSVLRNTGDEVVLQVAFSSPGAKKVVGTFSITKTGLVEVKPEENMNHLRLTAPLEYGVVPGFVGDDLIFGGPEREGTKAVAVPAENILLGLLKGEGTELVATWPKGKQQLTLHFGEASVDDNAASMDFGTEGQSLYLTALGAPGIWHKETLTADYLEKDVRIKWQPPFQARWKTQLFEEETKTTFAFRPSKGQVWRGVAGSYQYPVWLSGGDAYFRLGKKVQPKGESIIYFLEGRDTPLTVLTPVDVLQQTLGRQTAEPILDLAGRKLRTHHRRGADGVRRACTCGCTEAIQAVFEAGEEVSQSQEIQQALEDMIYFVHRHVERINEYQRFADGLLKRIETKRKSSPALKPFLDSIEEIVRQIPQECEVQKENMKNFAYADELSKKTMALAAKKDPKNLKAYMELLKAWREMGGAQDYVVAKCHVVTRNLCQTAGYRCATLPEAVPLAQEIRTECRNVLRNPDGYEIWADY